MVVAIIHCSAQKVEERERDCSTGVLSTKREGMVWDQSIYRITFTRSLQNSLRQHNFILKEKGKLEMRKENRRISSLRKCVKVEHICALTMGYKVVYPSLNIASGVNEFLSMGQVWW